MGNQNVSATKSIGQNGLVYQFLNIVLKKYNFMSMSNLGSFIKM